MGEGVILYENEVVKKLYNYNMNSYLSLIDLEHYVYICEFSDQTRHGVSENRLNSNESRFECRIGR